MKNFFTSFSRFFTGLLPREEDSPETRNFKVVVWGLLAVFALMLLAGTLAFLITLQGDEIAMVPNLDDRELVEALEMLQDRGLNVQVQQRYHSDPEKRGKVIDQSPDPGSQVRVGRTINITVSQGPVVDQVGDYVGLTLDQLRVQLAAQFTNYEALLEVRSENVSYTFSDQEAGTILSQDPAPGEQLSGYTDLNLLVSRGPEAVGIEAPEIVGLDYRQAIGLLASRSIPFVFRESTQGDQDAVAGLVLSQYPQAGELIEAGSALVLRIQPLVASRNSEVAGVYYGFIPEFAVAVNVAVDFTDTDAQTQRFFQTERQGGELSFPYVLETGSIISIYADGDLISRYTVQPEVENTDQ